MLAQEFGENGVRIWELELSERGVSDMNLRIYMSNLSDWVIMKDIWNEIGNFEGTEFIFGLSLGFGL